MDILDVFLQFSGIYDSITMVDKTCLPKMLA